MRSLHQALILQVGAHDDAARIQVIVQRLAFTQKFRAEDDVLAACFFKGSLKIFANRLASCLYISIPPLNYPKTLILSYLVNMIVQY